MRQIITITFLFLLLFFVPFFGDGVLPPDFQVEERNRAIELFHSQKFQEALPLFKKLSEAYPSDYLLKYFTGACMVETGDFSKETEMNLLLAGTRDVPSKVHYYLGRYYHSKEDWDNALRFYNRFKNNSQAEDIRALGVDGLIQNAFDTVNPYSSGDSQAAPVLREDSGTIKADISGDQDTVRGRLPETKPVTVDLPPSMPPDVSVMKKADSSLVVTPEQGEMPSEAVKETGTTERPSGDPKVEPPGPPSTRAASIHKKHFIRFQVNPRVTYLMEDLFQVGEAKEAWKAATAAEADLKHTMDTLEILRQQYLHPAHLADRASLSERIISLERRSLLKKTEAESLFQKARMLEQAWWEDADLSVYERFSTVTDSIARLEEALRIAALPPPPVIDDLLILEDTEITIDEAGEEEEETGVIYKVQLGSYAKGVRVPARTQALFDKISKIRTIDTFVNDDGATVYTTGSMKTFADGQALQNQVRLEGIKDAFVIAVQDGKRISLQDAKSLTGEE